MLRLSCQIEILHDHKKITFPYVSEVSVNTSIENYTDKKLIIFFCEKQ